MTALTIPEAAEAININYGGQADLKRFDPRAFEALTKKIGLLIASSRLDMTNTDGTIRVDPGDILAIIEKGNDPLTRVW